MNYVNWIDSHCHPHLLEVDLQEEAIKQAIEKNIQMLCVAVDLGDYEKLAQFASKFSEHVWIALGSHPLHEVDSNFDSMWRQLKEHVKADKRVIAIGETGFDFQGDYKKQRKLFEKHVEAACENDLPIILHTRDSEQETMAAIKDAAAHYKNLKGVFHCFTGSIELAEFAVEMGWMISFSGIVTFKNAKSLQEVAMHLDKHNLLDYVLIETDAPYLAPQPMRGKVNMPAYVAYVGEFLAQLYGKSENEFANLLKNNFNRLFNIKEVQV